MTTELYGCGFPLKYIMILAGLFYFSGDYFFDWKRWDEDDGFDSCLNRYSLT
jgi:hypothetical protein